VNVITAPLENGAAAMMPHVSIVYFDRLDG
jgi:hypothetical protein